MILITIIFLTIIALLGAPLFSVLAAAGLLASQSLELSPDLLIIEMNRLTSSPNMIALPLFILAGVVMSAGGAAQRLVVFFHAAFGWLPGGIAIAAIAACAFFTMFSGASGVTILALGGLLYPILVHEGYQQNFSLGLLTTSGSLGLLFPPSLAILIFGIVAGASIEQLFMAGLVPGILLMVMLTLYSLFIGKQQAIKCTKFELPRLISSIRRAFWDLMLPAAIIIGIFGGYVSITEAAAATASYVLFIETIVYRQLNLREQLLPLLTEASVLFGSLLTILLIALGLTNLLIDIQIPMKMLAFIEQYIDNKFQFLLLLNFFLLVVGAMMDIFSAIVVVVPIILPLAARYGIDPVHLGVIFLANLEIGYSTPPIGINLFIASQRFNQPIIKLFKSTLPFLLLMFIWLMIITYVPEISLWWQIK